MAGETKIGLFFGCVPRCVNSVLDQLHVACWVGTTVFRIPRNFEPSHGICPFPRNFCFHRICRIRYWTVIRRKIRHILVEFRPPYCMYTWFHHEIHDCHSEYWKYWELSKLPCGIWKNLPWKTVVPNAECCVMMLWLQQLDLPSESSQPGSSLSLRVQPAQSTGTPATTTSRPANENSDAVNNNVMSHSVTNPQALSQRVQRSSSTTNPQKNGQSKNASSCFCWNFNKTVCSEQTNFFWIFSLFGQCLIWLICCINSFNFVYFTNGAVWILLCVHVCFLCFFARNCSTCIHCNVHFCSQLI